MNIRDHHRRAIDRLTETYRDDADFLGLILAHNRRLFPYHKWLPRALDDAPDKPQDFMCRFDALLEQPTGNNASALFESVRDFRNWGVSDLDAYTWFMTDVEWAWMSDRAPLEDW